MGLRFFLVLLGIWVIYLVFRRTVQQRQSRGSKHKELPAVDVVCCHRCGTHLPAPDALELDGRYFCCPEHRDDGNGPANQTE